MSTSSRLELALHRGFSRGGDLIREIASLNNYPIRSENDAHALCLGLARLVELPPEVPEGPIPNRTPVDWLIGLFQQVETPAAYEVFVKEGLPQLYALFDAKSNRVDLLFLLKLFALYRTAEGAERVRDAALAGLQSEGRLWSIIFRQFEIDHPFSLWLADQLRQPLPQGFIAVAYLDWVNVLLLSEQLQDHPFDNEEGAKLLLDWLKDQDTTRTSYAQSAAASLPFLEQQRRDDLLILALDHRNTDVQMEAAWASAKIGGAAGIRILGRMCLDPMTSKTATRYLQELDREDAIPEAAFDPNFVAKAELVSWLAHPQEFGQPPEGLELLHTRELYWPPTKDRRHFWIFSYHYPQEGHQGIALVGSITFSLPEAHHGMPPEDIFALHCAWELEQKRSPLAAEVRDIASARKLLASHQEGF